MSKRQQDLSKAKKNKKDEFYTQLTDIEKELRHFSEHFKDTIVYCNCDDPTISNFFRYFKLKFRELGLNSLITTCYKNQNYDLFSQHKMVKSIGIKYDGDNEKIFYLNGDGDFRSSECITFLKKADIVVTNPPFSLFREYVAQLIENNKKFIIIGNINALSYKEIFPLIKDEKIWLGASIKSGDREFGIPDHYSLNAANTREDENGKKFIRVKGVRWFTNIDFKKRHEKLILYKKYSEYNYQKFDNYNAINVDKTKDIPIDYEGAMGVPITFLDRHNPDQFEILNANDILVNNKISFKEHGLIKDKDGSINGKPKYVRVVIRNKGV